MGEVFNQNRSGGTVPARAALAWQRALPPTVLSAAVLSALASWSAPVAVSRTQPSIPGAQLGPAGSRARAYDLHTTRCRKIAAVPA